MASITIQLDGKELEVGFEALAAGGIDMKSVFLKGGEISEWLDRSTLNQIMHATLSAIKNANADAQESEAYLRSMEMAAAY